MSSYHLTVGGQTWCQWTGCQAGLDIAAQAHVTHCHFESFEAAYGAAAALAPHFKAGAVEVVEGDCPAADPREAR